MVEILEEHEAYPSALPARRDQRHSAWVTIQIGCDNSCTFCIVPIVRGPEISRRMGDIVREVEELAADGVREITVLGQNVNSYGRDLGAGQYRPQFADLLRALDAVDGIERIRFTSPHPKDLRPETIAAMAECGSVCEHLHLPLQSGSDRTLARMHRGYTAERYLRRLADARAAIPDLAVTTDLIVGFPGETDADFVRTLEVVDAAGYDAAYTFVFSPRPGTPAADMTDDFVAPEVAQERMSRLVEVVERHALAKHEARVGRTETLLVEGPSKKDPARVVGPHPPEQARALRTRARTSADGRRQPPTSASPAPRRTGSAATCVAVRARPASGPHPHPRHRRACVTCVPHLAIVGPTASGKSALALEVARGVRRRRDRVDRLDAGLPRPRHRHRQAHRRPSAPRSRTTWSTWPSPTTSGRWRGSRHEARAAIADIERRGQPRAARRRHRSVRAGGDRPAHLPAGGPRRCATRCSSVPRRPRASPPPTPSSQRVDPAAAARIEPGNARRIARALEVIQITGRPFSSFGAGLQEFGPPVFPVRIAGVWLPRAGR